MAKINYQRIVVGVDFSLPSRAAMRHAIGLAQHHQAELDVVHVIEDSFRAALPWAENARKHVKELRVAAIEAATKKLEKFVPAASDITVHRSVKTGDVDEEMLKLAKRRRADLIVIANVGRRRMGQFIMGSTAADILRVSQTPVLLVPEAR